MNNSSKDTLSTQTYLLKFGISLIFLLIINSNLKAQLFQQVSNKITIENILYNRNPKLEIRSSKQLYKGIKYYEITAFKKAKEQFTHSLTFTYPVNFPAYNNQGATVASLRNYPLAEMYLTKASFIISNNDTINYNLALVYKNLHRNQLAITYLNKISNQKFIKTPNYFFNKAFNYSELLQHYQAIESYTSLLSIDPGNIIGLNNRATENLILGNYEISLNDYNRSIKNAHGLLKANCNFGMAINYYNQKKFKFSKDNFQKANASNKKNIDGLIGLSFAQIELGKYNDAENNLKLALYKNWNPELIYVGLGYDYYMLKRFGMSYYYFEKALDINPNCIMALLGKGYWFCNQKMFISSRNCFEKVLRIDPENEAAHIGNAISFFEENQFEQARNEFELVEVFDTSSVTNYYTYYVKGLTYYFLNDFIKADYNFKKCVNLSDGSEASLIVKGSINYYEKNYHEAIRAFTKALIINPKNDETYVNRGNALIELRSFNKAISDFKKAFEINPDNIDALNGLGLTYTFKGKNTDNVYPSYQKAIIYFDSAIAKKTDFGFLFNNRGLVYSYIAKHFLETNQIDSSNYYYNLSKKDYESALEYDYLPSEINIANILLEKENYDTALVKFQVSNFKFASLNNIGVIYARQDEISKADEYFNLAIDSTEDNYFAKQNLANLFRTKKKFTVVYYYQHLVKNSPSNHPLDLGKLYLTPEIIDCNNYLLIKKSVF